MQDWKMTDWKMTDEVAGVEWRSATRANVGMYAFLGHLQNTTATTWTTLLVCVTACRSDVLSSRQTWWMKHASRLACPDLTVVRTTDYGSCVLWATPLVLTPTRYSPAKTPTVPTTTTTTTSSWHRLLPARRPQRRYQERQLPQTPSRCCEVCLLAPIEGFALVPCGHARFCENCARRVADEGGNCPLCRAVISMVMRVFA